MQLVYLKARDINEDKDSMMLMLLYVLGSNTTYQGLNTCYPNTMWSCIRLVCLYVVLS